MRHLQRFALGAVAAGALAGQSLASDEPRATVLASQSQPLAEAASPSVEAPAPIMMLPATAPTDTPMVASPAPVSAPPQVPAAAPAPASPPQASPATPETLAPAPAQAAAAVVEPDPLNVLVRARLAAAAASAPKADREALAAFYAANPTRLLWIGDVGYTARAERVVAALDGADDWGLKAADFVTPVLALPNAGGRISETQLADAEIALSLAALKYARHARGGRMDPGQLSNYIDRDPPLKAPAKVVSEIAESADPGAYLRGLHPQHPEFERLRTLYVSLKAGSLPAQPVVEEAVEPPTGRKGKTAAKPKPVVEAITADRVLYNMEQWRWMPETLGSTYVWSNIPEYTVRIVKGSETVFSERIIAGKTDTQTPLFSDEMETIVFHPFWGVPDSIKVKELLPGLARGSDVLARNGLRLQRGGRDIDPGSVDWRGVDIRNFHVYQPPGGSNVLGQVKFLFPNKHQVYMHDTPTKSLFNASQRTFSHGCMRVRNPLTFATALLQMDKGWNAAKIQSLVNGGPQNNNVQLATKLPVHVTYFTIRVDESGKATAFKDVYGHESRIKMGLDGKAHLIVKKKDDLGPVRADAVSRLAETKPSAANKDWMRSVFGQF